MTRDGLSEASFRSALQVLAGAVSTLAAIGAACLGLQALGLPKPTHHDLVAGAVIGRLLGYRAVRGHERLNGRTASSLCVWAATPARQAGRLMSQETAYLGGRQLPGGTNQWPDPGRFSQRLAAFLAAGCPVTMSNWIGAALEQRRVSIRSTRVEGKPAYAVRAGAPSRQMTLLVSRLSLSPLAVRVRVGSFSGSNVIESTQARSVSTNEAEVAAGDG